MREDAGLSRRDLARKLQIENPSDARMHVSDRTLARIEEDGVVPTARVKFAITHAFDMVPSEVWGARTAQPRRRVSV